jgi:three-Cys-motif partner protein
LRPEERIAFVGRSLTPELKFPRISRRIDPQIGIGGAAMALDPEQYVIGDDELVVEKVGPWVKDRLDIIAGYVQITGATRRKYSRNRPAFIDIFSGPGRSLIRETDGEYIDGSAVTAFRQGQRSAAPFASIEVSDREPELLAAAKTRLEKVGAPVTATPGPAIDAVAKIVPSLNPNGLHFALLDPHNLGALSFSIIEQLANLRYVDIMVHVSVSDLQRNAALYESEAQQQFGHFAPGWREKVSLDANLNSVRASLIEYWSDLVERLGLPRARHAQLIKGSRGQRLYWLMLLSRHPKAHEFWEKITSPAKQPTLF